MTDDADLSAPPTLCFLSAAARRALASGLLTEAETYYQRTGRASHGGLHCEQVFGPTHDWQCFCGKFSGQEHAGVICDRCGVLVASSQLRDQRWGLIELPMPVVHPLALQSADLWLAEWLGLPESEFYQLVFRQKTLGELGAETGAAAIRTLLDRQAEQFPDPGELPVAGIWVLPLLGEPTEWSERLILDSLLVPPPAVRPVRLDWLGEAFTEWSSRPCKVIPEGLDRLYLRILEAVARIRQLQAVSAWQPILDQEANELQGLVIQLFGCAIPSAVVPVPFPASKWHHDSLLARCQRRWQAVAGVGTGTGVGISAEPRVSGALPQNTIESLLWRLLFVQESPHRVKKSKSTTRSRNYAMHDRQTSPSHFYPATAAALPLKLAADLLPLGLFVPSDSWTVAATLAL